MGLDEIHLKILRFLYENTPEEYGDDGDVSRKVLLKSINYKPRQIEKACKELESRELVIFYTSVYHNEWVSISISDQGLDYIEAP